MEEVDEASVASMGGGSVPVLTTILTRSGSVGLVTKVTFCPRSEMEDPMGIDEDTPVEVPPTRRKKRKFNRKTIKEVLVEDDQYVGNQGCF